MHMGKSGKSNKPRVSSLARAAASAEEREEYGDKFDVGTFRVRWSSCEMPDPKPGKSAWLVMKFVGSGKDKKIGEREQLQCISDTSLAIAGRVLKSLCRSLVGLDKEAYAEFDPHGEFIDAITENSRDGAAEYIAEHFDMSEKKAAALLDSEVIVKVTRGNDTDSGDFFREVAFSPVAADEDDAEDEDDSDDEEPESARKPAKKKASKRPEPEDDEDEEDDSDDDDDSDDEEPESEPAPKRKAKASKRK